FTSFASHPSPPTLYTLSLHDALPISHNDGLALIMIEGALHRLDAAVGDHRIEARGCDRHRAVDAVLYPLLRHHAALLQLELHLQDRKSTRLNSSHVSISYAVFCLKNK